MVELTKDFGKAVYEHIRADVKAWGPLPKRPMLVGHVCQYVCPECKAEKFCRWILGFYLCKRVSKHRDRMEWCMTMTKDLGIVERPGD